MPLPAPSAHRLSAREQAIVREEEDLGSAARDAIARATPSARHGSALERRMLSLRDEMSSAKSDDMAALAAEAQRVRTAAQHAFAGGLPDLAMPYFAHMQLETDRGIRDVMLGPRSFIDAKSRITIVDWREAPVAQVFFHYQEGEDYEQEYPDRCVEGVLRKRRVVVFSHGELVEIQTRDQVLRKDADGRWSSGSSRQRRFEGGEGGDSIERIIGTGLSGEKLPVISSLLDEQQYSALTRDATRPLLILGGAGCGKTTVALHRLAYLAYQQPDHFDPRDSIVIVPEEGLVRLTRTLLEGLEMSAVRVTTVDEWFAEQAEALLPELPQRLSENTPPGVAAIKRHPALAALLPAVAHDAGLACAERIDRQLGWERDFQALYQEGDEAAPLGRLQRARSRFIEAIPRHGSAKDAAAARSHFERVFEIERKSFESVSADRERLLGDRELLERAVRDSDGELRPSMVDAVIGHARTQLAPTAEEEYADVDSARRAALDGRTLDAGTPFQDAGTIDVEDFALLIELHRQKTGAVESAAGRLAAYNHVLLDEAQELSRVELGVIGSAVAQDGSVTVAGDPAQQLGVATHFEGWESVMRELGQGRADPVMLETSYRCTRPIIDFARSVLGPFAPDEKPRVVKDGAPVAHSHVPSWMHAEVLLGESLAELLDREPKAQVAVIAREDERARLLHDSLRRQLPLRLVLDGRFSFQPGIDVTAVAQVKGLEFDYVIVPDATASVYPDDPVSRRMLHVAATRAVHQLWIVAVGTPSPLSFGSLPP